MINANSVKGRVNNFAKKNNIQPQTVLHMYFFEKFLLRLEKSPYRDNFIIKGGLLVSQIIGIARRTTLDMDTTIKGLPLTKENILKIMKEIYDLYWVMKLKGNEIHDDVLQEAIVNTCTRRDSLEKLKNKDALISEIVQDKKLVSLWEDYKSKNRYVGDLKFEEVLKTLCEILKKQAPYFCRVFFCAYFRFCARIIAFINLYILLEVV